MDPRSARTRDALHAAVLDAAAARPIDEVSAAALCRAAGVTRDTFYRYASSPTALLADALGVEIAAVTAAHQDADGAISADGGFHAAERALLTHVADRAGIYRNAMRPSLPSAVRDNVERILRDALVAHLRLHPDAVPAAVSAAGERGVRVLAAYAASGTVGAIEAWLGDDSVDAARPLDVEEGVRLILAASPTLWLLSTGEPLL